MANPFLILCPHIIGDVLENPPFRPPEVHGFQPTRGTILHVMEMNRSEHLIHAQPLKKAEPPTSLILFDGGFLVLINADFILTYVRVLALACTTQVAVLLQETGERRGIHQKAKAGQLLDSNLIRDRQNALHRFIANPVLTEIGFIRGDPLDRVSNAAARHIEAAQIKQRAIGPKPLVREWSTWIRSPTCELTDRRDSFNAAQRLPLPQWINTSIKLKSWEHAGAHDFGELELLHIEKFLPGAQLLL